MSLMTKRAKPSSKEQSTTHPETTKQVRPGVADQSSSKANGKMRDVRTAHDKDGNEQHPKAATR